MSKDQELQEVVDAINKVLASAFGIPLEFPTPKETPMAMKEQSRDPREMAISSGGNDPRYPNRPRGDVNPRNELSGHFTGRFGRRGPKDLWDDNSAYGCNNCGATYCN